MIPYYIIIALVVTLLTVAKEYVFRTRIFDYAINTAFVLAWAATLYPTMWCYVSISAFVLLLFILSYNLWGRSTTVENVNVQPVDFTTYDNGDNKIIPFMAGSVGKVVSALPQGGYLGTTLKDGSPVEIIVHCKEEELKPGDEFEIQGACGTEIIAIKK